MLVIRISQLAGAVMPSGVMRPSGVVMPSGSDLQSRQLLPRLHRLIVNVPERTRLEPPTQTSAGFIVIVKIKYIY